MRSEVFAQLWREMKKKTSACAEIRFVKNPRNFKGVVAIKPTFSILSLQKITSIPKREKFIERLLSLLASARHSHQCLNPFFGNADSVKSVGDPVAKTMRFVRVGTMDANKGQ